MNDSGSRKSTGTGKGLWWIARISGTAVVLLLLMMFTGDEASLPSGAEWIYLTFFPFGFSVGYMIGWRWPFVGGVVSLVCMAMSQVVTGRVFNLQAYMIWGVLSVPGLLYVIAGWKLRKPEDVER